MIVVDVPRHAFPVVTFDWNIDWRGQSAGSANDGSEGVVYNRFPAWVGTPTISLNRAGILQWRAIRSMAQGRTNPYRVPMVDKARPFRGEVPFSTGSTFSAGIGLAYLPAAITVAAAAPGATELLVTERDEAIVVGQFVSHDDWPYVVTWRDADGANVRIGIQMPLRRAIPAGAEVMLRATGLFVATDDTMGAPSSDGVPFSRPQLSFREFLGPGR